MHDPRLSVIVVTGFLGAGKTTLINALIHSGEAARTALLINEFGDIGIDHQLVDGFDDQIALLGSGCLCCMINGDLNRALWKLFQRVQQRELPPLDRIIIETSGLADPTPVAYSLINDALIKQRFRCDGIVTVVDALNGLDTESHFEEWLRQVSIADRLVLTKTDLATPAMIQRLRARLALVNPFAECIDAADPAMTPATLFLPARLNEDADRHNIDRWLGSEAPPRPSSPCTTHEHHGHEHCPHCDERPAATHTPGIQAYSMTFAEPFAWGALSQTLDTLLTTSGDQILRIKGLINVQGESTPRVIHCVRHLRYPASTLTAWPDDDRNSRLVFITRNYPRDYLAEAFSIFSGQAPLEVH